MSQYHAANSKAQAAGHATTVPGIAAPPGPRRAIAVAAQCTRSGSDECVGMAADLHGADATPIHGSADDT